MAGFIALPILPFLGSIQGRVIFYSFSLRDLNGVLRLLSLPVGKGVPMESPARIWRMNRQRLRFCGCKDEETGELMFSPKAGGKKGVIQPEVYTHSNLKESSEPIESIQGIMVFAHFVSDGLQKVRKYE